MINVFSNLEVGPARTKNQRLSGHAADGLPRKTTAAEWFERHGLHRFHHILGAGRGQLAKSQGCQTEKRSTAPVVM